MSNLILVRHGQATAFSQVTDRLSEVGEEQSRRLGEYWLRQGLRFDEVYSGPLERQRRTAEIVGKRFEEAGMSWPGVRVLPELAEYHAEALLSRGVPELSSRDPHFRELAATLEIHRHGPERNRHFQRMFEALMKVWVAGGIPAPDLEQWDAFRERVRQGIERITASGGNRRTVAAFTSGGCIGVTVQAVLSAPVAAGLELNWRVRNCSLTEILFSGNRLSLDLFNAIPHLDDPAVRTFR